MERVPKGWMFSLGLSVLAVVAALIASTADSRRAERAEAMAGADSCVRYGKVECCVRGE
ncbi:MAG: hypothetical protein ABMA64_11455 [Myxococcota bacterium]